MKTALEMHDAVDAAFDGADIAVFTAAVSDFRPREVATSKLKKGEDDQALTTVELVENIDILATMGQRKRPGQFVVGFAAETENVEENARKKLRAKHADLIVGNLVGDGRGFGTDTNEVVLVDDSGERRPGPMTKRQLADVILDKALVR